MTTRSVAHVGTELWSWMQVTRSPFLAQDLAHRIKSMTGDGVRIINYGDRFQVQRWTGTRWVKA